MKTHEIKIQTNIFNAIQRPTTQEDNFGDIIDRYDLFYKFYLEVNGNETERRVGHLVRYYNDSFTVFHDQLRYEILKEDVKITLIRKE